MFKNLVTLFLAITLVIISTIFVYKNVRKNDTITIDINKQKDTITLSKEQIEDIVKDFIHKNPDVLIRSLENLQKKPKTNATKKTDKYIKDNLKELEEAGNPPFIGNKDSDISVIIFYDYNCGYCKKADRVVSKLSTKDPNVKFIARPLALLGDNSAYAAKIFLATYKIAPQKLDLVHNELMNVPNALTPEITRQIAQKYDIDYMELENEINSDYIQELLTKNHHLAKSINVLAVPSFIINGNFVKGMIKEESFEKIILELRSKEPQK